jgi:hypothetical protein
MFGLGEGRQHRQDKKRSSVEEGTVKGEDLEKSQCPMKMRKPAKRSQVRKVGIQVGGGKSFTAAIHMGCMQQTGSVGLDHRRMCAWTQQW